MKKAIWVVVVDNYLPGLCRITLPSLEKYASKIGASFNVIRNRRWPQVTAPYEKLQVFDLGRGNDWNIILDADMFIDETMSDVTAIVPSNSIASWMCYLASERFPCDEYFFRDGRQLGVSFSFLVVPSACHEALMPFPDAEVASRQATLQRQFMLDEYCLSRNVARFGLKYCGILSGDLNNPPFRHLNSTSGHESHA